MVRHSKSSITNVCNSHCCSRYLSLVATKKVDNNGQLPGTNWLRNCNANVSLTLCSGFPPIRLSVCWKELANLFLTVELYDDRIYLLEKSSNWKRLEVVLQLYFRLVLRCDAHQAKRGDRNSGSSTTTFRY